MNKRRGGASAWRPTSGLCWWKERDGEDKWWERPPPGGGWTEPEGEAEELRQKHSEQSFWSSVSAAAD